ncbi:type IV pilus biogenesis protein PilM [Planococcus lenghuensis]|uniref:Pilus assembly protein PilM n=1 Tax=Planococcus lenghuensis TaxID=2213202 RepID=A0A1Q2KZ29_9BACL|nr:pilus assembly protein PilM [Planococcus lenghuensis]AQQ52892.1 pilus assembly protein PilM [Planococcus lenghuensis]
MKLAPSFLNRRTRVMTVTIEEDAVRCVELRAASPLQLDFADEIMLPLGTIENGKVIDPEALASVLDEAVVQWKLSKKFVRFLAPDEFVVIRKVPYPHDVQTDELKGYFFIEIGSTLHLPFDDPAFDVVPYKTDGESPEAIIIASKESVLKQYEDSLSKSKMKPLVADISPLALYRLAYMQHDFSADEHVMLLDVYKDSVTVSIFNGHYPLFMRHVDFSKEMVTGEQEKVALINTEAEKIANFYRYNMQNGEMGVSKIVTNGEFEDWQAFQQLMEQRFSVPVMPIVLKPIPSDTEQAVPARFNRAIGLALKEV